jgi:hypothetical protein
MTLVGEGSGGYSDESGPGRSSYSAISYAAAMACRPSVARSRTSSSARTFNFAGSFPKAIIFVSS